MAFTPIETQEQFDEIIKDRLARERKKVEDSFAGYISPEDLEKKTSELTKQVGDLNKALEEAKTAGGNSDKTIQELTSKVSAYELEALKTKITLEKELPYELRNRLTGTTEEELIKDADALKLLINGSQSNVHISNMDDRADNDEARGAYKEMLSGLNLRGE